MRTIELHHIDAFTDKPFMGNPTVCVVNAECVTLEEMQKIAIEMQLPESSFILPSKEADFRLRFFTRTGHEIKFCGHATFGALTAIAKAHIFGIKPGIRKELFVETHAGILSMLIDYTENDPKFSYELPKIDMQTVTFSQDVVLDAMGISKGLIDDRYPVMLEMTNNYLYLASSSLDALSKISIDLDRTTQFAKDHNIVLFCILTPHAMSKNNHVHARGFAPSVGIPEDPFTGSMQGGLAQYLRLHKIIPKDQTLIRSEQGHFMGRGGEAEIVLTDLITPKARLSTKTYHMFQTSMHLP